MADHPRYSSRMLLYRLLLGYHSGVLALLLLLFVIWPDFTPDILPKLALWLLLLLFTGAAIGAGTEYRRRGEVRAANLSLALLGLPALVMMLLAAALAWLLSGVEML